MHVLFLCEGEQGRAEGEESKGGKGDVSRQYFESVGEYVHRCSVLQCNTLQHRSVAERCRVLQSVAQCRRVLRCIAVRYSALQCVAVCCSALQCVAVYYSVLQCVAVC